MSYWSTPEALADISPRDDRWPEDFDVLAKMRRITANASRILDFGCGDGRLVPAFDPKRYVGVDINPFAIEKCRELYPDYRFTRCGRYLPRADIAICYAVLLHVPDADIRDTVKLLAAAAPRVIVVEILGRSYRGPGNPPVFNRESKEYRAIFLDAGMALYAKTDKKYNRYGGAIISIMDFRKQ